MMLPQGLKCLARQMIVANGGVILRISGLTNTPHLASNILVSPLHLPYPSRMTESDAAREIATCLHDAGYQSVFAGGCVRDRLLHRPPKDYDIATNATPKQVLELFPKSNEVGAHFGVILVKRHGHMVEIATFRTDGSYSDGRRPDQVAFSTAEEDAQRRDFTINGLFEDPNTGTIIDYVGGRADIEAKLLRAIGDPTRRFQEDSLRLMRAIRFACALDFAIEEKTWQAIRDGAPLLARIAPERIREELNRMMLHPSRAKAFTLLAESGLFRHFWPEVMELIGCEQPPEWHPEGDVFTHTRIMLELLEPDAPLNLALAVLLHDIAKPPTRSIDHDAGGRIRFNGHDALGAEMAGIMLRRLRYPNDTHDTVVAMVSRHMQFMNVQQMRTAKLKRFMAAPAFEQEMELHRVDCASSNGFTDNYEYLLHKQEEFANEPLIPAPLVTGRDLIQAGFKPGPLFSEILETIQVEQLEGRLLTRDEALTYFRTHWPTPA
jgi:tRNA nucleotidyltransferase/poly(A) polymerase